MSPDGAKRSRDFNPAARERSFVSADVAGPIRLAITVSLAALDVVMTRPTTRPGRIHALAAPKPH